jgi:rSAM/selenodomain-associated transferase 2
LKEIIVVDGGSTDGTAEIAVNAGATCIAADRPGRALQMNMGAKAASGEILLFVHADTRLPSGWSELISGAVTEGFSAGCFRLSFGHPSPILKMYGWFTRFDMDFMRFGDQGLFITTTEFRNLGGYREDHRVLEDNEFTRRIRAAGVEFKVMQKAAVTSPRRYLEQGTIRLQLIFACIYAMWRLGVPQDKLIAYYRRNVVNRVPE